LPPIIFTVPPSHTRTPTPRLFTTEHVCKIITALPPLLLLLLPLPLMPPPLLPLLPVTDTAALPSAPPHDSTVQSVNRVQLLHSAACLQLKNLDPMTSTAANEAPPPSPPPPPPPPPLLQWLATPTKQSEKEQLSNFTPLPPSKAIPTPPPLTWQPFI
jgi:hypothetical protein